MFGSFTDPFNSVIRVRSASGFARINSGNVSEGQEWGSLLVYCYVIFSLFLVFTIHTNECLTTV